MKYIHVKNLEKYHPGYKDRKLQWAKLYFTAVQGDPDWELIDNEIDFARMIKFIILELEAQQPIPINEKYLTKKGFNLKKRPIFLTLNLLHNFVDVVTQLSKTCVLEEEKEEEKEKEEDKDRNFKSFVTATVVLWNNFCKNHPTLSSIKEITPKRRSSLKQRFSQKSFREFEAVLRAVADQPFLLGRNDRKWCVSFDWLISNDTNYVKVLERKYSDKSEKKKPREEKDYSKLESSPPPPEFTNLVKKLSKEKEIK